ncbi:palmitoyl-protein thioesterase 1-like isoform X2 [Mesocricetus auratus]|uniref:Palmitoyl-protein thioesterase 1-like isoform X2 n=1 Tax=Mesocricetus auratus TaxID=10036 RepID=A0ABM2YCY3_MESAU|nr:palmitoyl-protein thioesterase 1-like isoform X2 [Mesocricetus auratus]
MIFPGSQWILCVCLLSWCCDAGVLREVDPASESEPAPAVTWYEKGFYISRISTNKIIGKEIPGVYVLPLVTGNNVTEDMENNIFNGRSQVCEILAKYFAKLQQGYIVVTVSDRLESLKELAEGCPIPSMKDMILVSDRKLIRIPRALPDKSLWICICIPRTWMKARYRSMIIADW